MFRHSISLARLPDAAPAVLIAVALIRVLLSMRSFGPASRPVTQAFAMR